MKYFLTLSLIALTFAACSTNAPVIEDDPPLATAQLGAGTSTQIIPAHLTSPLCVVPNVNTPAPGALLYQNLCTTAAASMSTPQPVAGKPGVFQIKNDATGKLCFDVNRNSTNDGTSVILWTCHGRSNQLWNLKRVTDTVVDEQQNAFQVISMRSKRCLEVKGAATIAGAPLQIATCKTGDIKARKNQVFYFNGIKQTDLQACSRQLTEANIEGPFFTANSPKRNDLLESDIKWLGTNP
jgi:Ricin-type beta-trefoil lectin domain-like